MLQSSVSVLDPDPHQEMPPRSGSAWTDADPDPYGHFWDPGLGSA